ncbi:FAD/NAD(P)-binding protein [Pseudomonas sp. SK3(2021)]|uniref:FAD/NAD(P)-binding protein n=1 Tax=Pseudomonas sp. SK3(2021) TaxID=2841064 RepID=UPI00192A86D2|nr:FAD/NAD(P)-binding protein [Pseudomonas sp. SK3(2021)]QQZ39433.1 FAD/NAD(P)-binding protein [Pseudomonas sp. SK3(2021)]
MIDLTPRSLHIVAQYEDGEDARHFSFCIDVPQAGDLAARAGQFFMLTVPGLGEAPFTYVSPPDKRGHFNALIRRTGSLTAALFDRVQDPVLGYRGPFGQGWPSLKSARRVLVVAGGCGLAPLAGVIDGAINHPGAARLSVLYGARHAGSQVLSREREHWRSALPWIETFDVAPVGHRQGSPLAYLDELFGDEPPDTVLCCGPEPFMLATARDCMKRGVADRRIWLSVERRMHCADGLCGHCYVGESYACRDGPTYRYNDYQQLLASASMGPAEQDSGLC